MKEQVRLSTQVACIEVTKKDDKWRQEVEVEAEFLLHCHPPDGCNRLPLISTLWLKTWARVFLIARKTPGRVCPFQ